MAQTRTPGKGVSTVPLLETGDITANQRNAICVTYVASSSCIAFKNLPPIAGLTA